MRPEADEENGEVMAPPVSAITNGKMKGKGKMLNGSSKISQNGTTNGNTQPKVDTTSPMYLGHSRVELARLMIQALQGMGYTSTAETLTKESGFELESPTVAAFRSAVLEGRWAEVEDLLLHQKDESEAGLVLGNDAPIALIKFWIREQKFLELLEARDISSAVICLRSEITPVNPGMHTLHTLSSLLMCDTAEELKRKTLWDGARGTSREQLLTKLSQCLSPSVMIPPNRLATLLEKEQHRQVATCKFHTNKHPLSLFADHTCDEQDFEIGIEHEFKHHSGEIWHLEYAHDGTRLASCGSDGRVIVWDMVSLEPVFTLLNDEGSFPSTKCGITRCAWSLDDKYIVTCSYDGRASLWNAQEGDFVRNILKVDEPITSVAWHPNGKHIVIGSLAKDGLTKWTLEGDKVTDFGKTDRVKDVAITPDGLHIIVATDHSHLIVLSFELHDELFRVPVGKGDAITTISVSKDSKYVLIGGNKEVGVFDMELRGVYKRFSGTTAEEFAIRCSFGGPLDNLIMCGSEDGTFRIWHRESGNEIAHIDAHAPDSCNAIAWNPNNNEFASGGDDCLVKLWTFDVQDNL